MSQLQDETGAALPEPAHRSRWRRFSPSMGWRAFWSEIIIVVLGVVIALAANEAVQEWSWRNKVREAETRLQGDITWGFLWSAERYATFPCVDAQLAALSEKIIQGPDTTKPVSTVAYNTVNDIVRIPNRPYRFPVWDTLVAEGTAMHFTRQQQALFGRISEGMAQARVDETDSRRLMGRLLVLRHSLVLDSTLRAELLSRIEEIRYISGYQALTAQQRMRWIADAGKAPPAAVIDAFLDHRNQEVSVADFSGTAKHCRLNGLPLTDWRDYQKQTAGQQIVPIQEVMK